MQPKPRWLIEGVCGTGKSSMIAALTEHLRSMGQEPLVITEDDTFESLRERSLYRWEREAENWIAGNIAFYGSEAQAIEAFQISQQRRREYARLTQMTVHILDTTSQDWEKLVLGITQPEIHVLKGLPIQ